MTALNYINKRNGPSGDLRRTMCKLCRHSILTGEDAVWLSKPLGLSHLNCARSRGALIAEEA